MRKKAVSPLPQRDGVDAARVRVPVDAPEATLLEHLLARIPIPADEVARLFAEGRVVDRDGAPLTGAEPPPLGGTVFVDRELAPETVVPFDVPVLYRDERTVVVDKPPFLATIPRGRHVTQTVVARLRVQLGLPELTAAHRLDRLTSGVLLLTTERRYRGAYATLFAQGLTRKSYRALAPVRDGLDLPVDVADHISKPAGTHQAVVVDGAPVNARTRVELERVRPDGLGEYLLTPATGRTHQLRLHLARLGIPIVGDDLYPTPAQRPDDDFTTPLQLLAHRLAFRDPVTGDERVHESARSLPVAGAPVRGMFGLSGDSSCVDAV